MTGNIRKLVIESGYICLISKIKDNLGRIIDLQQVIL